MFRILTSPKWIIQSSTRALTRAEIPYAYLIKKHPYEHMKRSETLTCPLCSIDVVVAVGMIAFFFWDRGKREKGLMDNQNN